MSLTVVRSHQANSQDPEWKKKVVIHTGNWGCGTHSEGGRPRHSYPIFVGAFGGNRTLMALIQFIAARFAGVDEIVYHAFDQQGVDACNAAHKLLGACVCCAA